MSTEYTPDTIAEQRRAYALDRAVRVASEQQVGKYDGKIIVNVATAFEEYLNGGDA